MLYSALCLCISLKGMLSLHNRLLQTSCILRHNGCIKLRKRYVALNCSALVMQLLPVYIHSAVGSESDC